MARATLRDVAAAAGVSRATASRALARERNVAADLVSRVDRAAAELGYRRNAAAGTLRSRRSKSVGIVIPQISNPFFPAIVEAVERHLQTTDRQLLLCDSQGSPDIEAARVRELVERQVDGLVISPCHSTASVAALAEARHEIPVVQLDRRVDTALTDWVGVDDDAAIRAIMEHLASVGVRDALYVGSTADNSSGRLRLNAFRDSARALHIRADRTPLLGAFTIEWGLEAGTRLLTRRGRRPEAIVCGNDEIAFGVLQQLRRRGIAVPRDVLVTGFDDVPFAELVEPPLTTVRQPHRRLAAEAVRLLDESDRDGAVGPPKSVAVVPDLIVRGSTTS